MFLICNTISFIQLHTSSNAVGECVLGSGAIPEHGYEKLSLFSLSGQCLYIYMSYAFSKCVHILVTAELTTGLHVRGSH